VAGRSDTSIPGGRMRERPVLRPVTINIQFGHPLPNVPNLTPRPVVHAPAKAGAATPRPNVRPTIPATAIGGMILHTPKQLTGKLKLSSVVGGPAGHRIPAHSVRPLVVNGNLPHIAQITFGPRVQGQMVGTRLKKP